MNKFKSDNRFSNQFIKTKKYQVSELFFTQTFQNQTLPYLKGDGFVPSEDKGKCWIEAPFESQPNLIDLRRNLNAKY